jgi:tetratricopeptide (TPR) repeat protein
VLPGVPLLADVLKKAGFATGAFVSTMVLDASSGLGRGFDTYDDAIGPGGKGAAFLDTLQRRGDVTTAQAIAWLEKTRGAAPDGRVFLWLHLYDPHDPYEPPEPFATRFAANPYDGEVAYADAQLGRLEDALTRLKLAADTALVVTSDHGEGLGQHGETLHGFFVYQTTLHVPLLLRGPGVKAGARLAGTVGLVDVFPTALDLLGLPATPGLVGRSLAPELRGGPASAPTALYAESLVPLLHFGWSDLRVLREGRFKYIQAPRPELYDLQADPGETTNLATTQASRALALRMALGRILDAERAQAAARGPADPAAIAPELLEKLGALGYVGGAAPAETATPGADPKDRIAEFRVANELMREGLLRFHAGDFAASAKAFQDVLASQVSSFEVHYYLARALMGLGRTAEAATHFKEATLRSPAFAPAQARLGDALRDLGRVPEAIRHQTEATKLAPGVAAYWNSLGMTLGGNARPAEAEHAFREATRLDPRHSRYAYNLGLILQRQGRGADARPWFEKTLELDPTFAPARERLASRQGRATQ